MSRREQKDGKLGEALALIILRQMGLCQIEKVGTPVTTIRDASGKISNVFYGEPVAADYRAVMPIALYPHTTNPQAIGQSVLAEVKTIDDRPLRFSDFRVHQPGKLTEHADLGGLSLVAAARYSSCTGPSLDLKRASQSRLSGRDRMTGDNFKGDAMLYLVIIVVLLLALVFGVASISQSASTAQQAQAAIEASRATQIVGANNLLLTIWAVVMTIIALALVVLVLYVVFRPSLRRPGRWQSRPGQLQQRGYDQLPGQQSGSSIETLIALMAADMMEERRIRRQQPTARMMIEDDEWKR